MAPTQSRQQFAYDRIAYPGAAEEFINLRNLEVAAAMCGVPTAELSQCRVLELGCADGTNLLPSAWEFPQSQFVGVDLAGDRIRRAREVAEEAGLQNTEFRHASVSDIDASIGAFDFILCPGVFSWVSDEERLAILRVCRDSLAANGIAVISYNTLPGWNSNASLRQFIRYHVRQVEDPQRQIVEARNLIEFLAACTSVKTSQGAFYAETRDRLRTKNDAYLYHEYLADHNQPYYFHEFDELATAHELRFVGEADFKHSSGFGLEPSARSAIVQAPPQDRQQLLDFLVNNHSRRSILCHADCQRTKPAQRDLIGQSHLALVDPLAGVEFDPADPQPCTLQFEHGSATISDTLVKAALRQLIDRWPNTAVVDELFSAACRDGVTSGPSQTDGPAVLAQAMLAIYGAGLIKVFKTPPRLIDRVSESPQVSPLVRSVAARGLAVVNQWHQNVPRLDAEERFILSQLDGTRDAAQLGSELERFRERQSEAAEESPASIDQMLESFAQRRLLIA